MEIKEKNCEVCGHTLNISKENTYIVKVENMLFHNTDDYDATDCPYCGCQNLLHKRYRKSDDVK